MTASQNVEATPLDAKSVLPEAEAAANPGDWSRLSSAHLMSPSWLLRPREGRGMGLLRRNGGSATSPMTSDEVKVGAIAVAHAFQQQGQQKEEKEEEKPQQQQLESPLRASASEPAHAPKHQDHHLLPGALDDVILLDSESPMFPSCMWDDVCGATGMFSAEVCAAQGGAEVAGPTLTNSRDASNFEAVLTECLKANGDWNGPESSGASGDDTWDIHRYSPDNEEEADKGIGCECQSFPVNAPEPWALDKIMAESNGFNSELATATFKRDPSISSLPLLLPQPPHQSDASNQYVGATGITAARDTIEWQSIGTSLHIGMTAEAGTPLHPRRRSSPSPPPYPPVAAALVSYDLEQSNVLASEENCPTIISSAVMEAISAANGARDGATQSSDRLPLHWSNLSVGTEDNTDAKHPHVSRGSAAMPHGTIVKDEGTLATVARSGGPGVELGYTPSMTISADVEDRELAFALARGSHTGRWIPLDNDRYFGRTNGGVREDDKDADGDGKDSEASAAAHMAMVASAMEELGDGKAHPVQWKQIKTWFENRRMTQKRIREGTRPVRRPNQNSHKCSSNEKSPTNKPATLSPTKRQHLRDQDFGHKNDAAPQAHKPELACKAKGSIEIRTKTSPGKLSSGKSLAEGGIGGKNSSGEADSGIHPSSPISRHGAKRARRVRSSSPPFVPEMESTMDKRPDEHEEDVKVESIIASAIIAQSGAMAAEEIPSGDKSALTRAMSWAHMHEALGSLDTGATTKATGSRTRASAR